MSGAYSSKSQHLFDRNELYSKIGISPCHTKHISWNGIVIMMAPSLSICHRIYNLNVWLSQNECAHAEQERTRDFEFGLQLKWNCLDLFKRKPLSPLNSVGKWAPHFVTESINCVMCNHNQHMQLQFEAVAGRSWVKSEPKVPTKKLIKTKNNAPNIELLEW